MLDLKKNRDISRQNIIIQNQWGDNELARYIARSKDNPIFFARRFLNIEPDDWQKKALAKIAIYDSLAIRSCNGPGKTYLLALIILWFLTTRSYPQIPCTAPTQSQLRNNLWGALSRLNQTFILKDVFEFQKERFFLTMHPETWYAVARSSRIKENLQGFHAENLLFVIDEAPGVDDEIFEAIDGSQTTAGAKKILMGNPTKLSGYFFNAFHKDKDQWARMHISADDSPRISKEYKESMAKRWGINSNVYRVRVLGEFPLAEAMGLLPMDLVEKAMGRYADEEDPSFLSPRILTCDPARFGTNKTAFAFRVGNKLTEIWTTEKESTMETTGRIVNAIISFKPDEVRVDETGIGSGIIDRLRELKYKNIVGIKFGGKSYRKDCVNWGSCAWADFLELLQRNYPIIPKDENIFCQLVSRGYSFSSDGKIKLQSKDELINPITNQEIESIDEADAIIMAFASKTEKRSKPIKKRPAGW